MIVSEVSRGSWVFLISGVMLPTLNTGDNQDINCFTIVTLQQLTDVCRSDDDILSLLSLIITIIWKILINNSSYSWGCIKLLKNHHLKMLMWPWLSRIDWHRTGARSWLNITEYHCQHTHHTLVTTAASPLTTTTPHQVTGHQSHVPASSHVDHDQCHTVTRLLVYDKTIIWLVGAGAEAVSHTGSHCIRWVVTLV